MKLLSEIKPYKKIILLAILLRMLIIPFYFHPDIKIYNFQASFLKNGVFNIYSYLDSNKASLPFKEEFVYFPLAYLFLGAYQIVALPFLGGQFTEWLNSGNPTDFIFRYLFILKLPYLFLDILIAILIYNCFEKKKQKEQALILWLFNPFSIILIYFFSNIDIIPVTLTLLSLLFIKKNKGLWAGIFLVLGASFKAYPILLLPALFLTKEKFKQKFINLLSSIALFVLILIPFWSKEFIISSFSSGLTNRIFENGIEIGLTRKIPYFLIFYTIGFVHIYFKKRQKAWLFYLLTTLMLIASVNYNIQWLLWFLPFLIIMLVKNPKYLIYVLGIILIGVAIPLLLNDRYMNVALLSPMSKIFLQVSYPYLFIQQFINPLLIQKILRILFFVFSILILYKAIVNQKHA